jgi:hypothetical protein
MGAVAARDQPRCTTQPARIAFSMSPGTPPGKPLVTRRTIMSKYHTHINKSFNHDSFNSDSYNHDFNNYQSYNHDSAITSTEQHGLLNLNASPALNLPVHDNLILDLF